jgi:hypothetical protein
MDNRTSVNYIVPIRKRWGIGPAGTAIVIVSSMVLMAAGWSLYAFGSIQQAVGYYLRGETLSADMAEKSFGIVSPGDPIRVPFKLTNRGRESVRVLGCSASCICILPDDLPFTLNPNESRDFVLFVSNPKPGERGSIKPSSLRFDITLFTNDPTQRRLPLVIKGEVRDRA